MTSERPTTIKKYANRRLYNTGSSAYVTLEDLAQMVKRGEDFVVYDAKTGEDLTRSVLAQVIFEQEAKVGQGLLPITFLRQLIRFYGDSVQLLVPSYLEFSLDRFAADRKSFDCHVGEEQSAKSATQPNVFNVIEEQARKNMAMFQQALSIFNPFAVQAKGEPPAPEPPASSSQDLEMQDMRQRLEAMQKAIEELAKRSS